MLNRNVIAISEGLGEDRIHELLDRSLENADYLNQVRKHEGPHHLWLNPSAMSPLS